MEIYTNLTPCVNGHWFNAAIHNVCPECGAPAQEEGNFGATTSPDNIGHFGATIDPGAAQASYGVSKEYDSFGRTEPARPASANAGNFGRTEPVLHNQNDSAAGMFSPTVAINHEADNRIEPVVGWLVCIEGPMRGNDYRIREGYNYIGREVGDIHIRGDQTISRQRHARIAYDSASHQYFFGPDEGRNLLRVNGKTIMNPVELHNYDVLTIGQSKLLFMGLCGEQFSWENV